VTASGTEPREQAADLSRLIDVPFDDPALLEMALTHRSWAFEHQAKPNERLEFLGDAVLALVVTDEVFHAHPEEQEGRLAKVRSAAVKTGSLATIARELGLGRYVKLGRGEAASGGHDKDSILADTLEAVIGAVYLDRGFATAYDLVQRLFGERLAEVAELEAALDYKTSLQELAASTYDQLPQYVVRDEGPDHEKLFRAEVHVDGRVVGQGQGRSKKQAEQRAAREAFRTLHETPDGVG
jgi:ribonuclease III